MVDPQQVVLATLRSILERRLDQAVGIGLESALQEDLDLDSLELAELSVTLEDEFGIDPYSAGLMPRTVGEVIAFYDDRDIAAMSSPDSDNDVAS